MYYKLSRLITLFVILACLPLQGLAAVTMPSCQMHDSKAVMYVGADHSGNMSHCDHHNADQPTKKTPCDKCFACHSIVAQAITPFNISVEFSGSSPMFTSQMTEIPDTVPSSLFHPPRLTFA